MKQRIPSLVAALVLPIALGAQAPAWAADDGAAAAAALEQALAGEHRSAENRARDAHRHPAGTLGFFGLEPSMTVIEILPGAGWYTEVLAPVLADGGRLVVAGHGTEGVNEYRRNSHLGLMKKLDADPALYGKVERRVMWTADGGVDLGPPGSADMVVTFRNTHNWVNDGGLDAVYQAIFEVLKPQGILGIEQHRAPADADAQAAAKNGYVPEDWLVERLEALGFKLVGKSEINANPRDTKDYPGGVWTLPPTYRQGDQDRDRYTAIGESDRMTLKFVKP